MKTFADRYFEACNNVDVDFKQILKLLDNNPSDSILEIGAGTGRLLPIYSGRPGRVDLVESSSDIIQILNDEIRKGKNLNLCVRQGYSFCLPYEDNSFNFVLIPFAGISEMSPLMFTLAECYRVLKPKGLLYFTAINPQASSQTSSQKFIIEQVCPSFKSWADLVALSNFNLIEAKGSFDDDEFKIEQSQIVKIVAEKCSSPQLQARTKNSHIASGAYDRLAPKYNEISGGEHYHVPLWLDSKFEKYVGLNPVILDVGCATGTTGKILAAKNIVPYFLFGLDVSPNMVEICRESKTYSAVACWDLNCGLLENKYMLYDLITAIGVLEFVDNLELVFNDFRNCLKIGGEILFTLEANSHGRSITTLKLQGGDFHRYAKSNSFVESLLKKVNLELVSLVQSEAYTSPTSGERVEYWYCHARKV